jgi:hypothetical protein
MENGAPIRLGLNNPDFFADFGHHGRTLHAGVQRLQIRAVKQQVGYKHFSYPARRKLPSFIFFERS